MSSFRDFPSKWAQLARKTAPTSMRKANGGTLRTGMGGLVSGAGNKIPAKYEPGEFVDSNAMLAKAPDLLDGLSDLRTRTLGGQVKLVAEADVQSVSCDGGQPSGRLEPAVPDKLNNFARIALVQG